MSSAPGSGKRVPGARADRTLEALRTRYDALSVRGRDLTRAGKFHDALRAYRVARAFARTIEDAHLHDVAELNVAMVRLQLGQAHAGEEGLREILLRSVDDRTAFSAAYHLASSLRKQSRFDKATVYAARALDRASVLRSQDLLAMAEMLMGNILLAQSYDERALVHYRRAMTIRERQPGDTRYSRAILLENVGYCLVLGGDLDGGTATLRAALDLANEVGDRRCLAECAQDLCYAHLLAGGLEDACTFGESALATAREERYDDIEENCHYLLGEVYGRRGDLEARDQHFARLQDRHPELPFLKDFLCAVDVTSIITLKR